MRIAPYLERFLLYLRRGVALFVGICYYESVKFLKYDSMSNEALFGYVIL